MDKVRPFLWLDDAAEQAANLYVSLFESARIISISRTGEEPSAPARSVTFELEGVEFIAFNGGPHFKPSMGISFMIKCETQAEVDRIWDALVAGGTPSRCGWLTDRYGVTWQVVPSILPELLEDDDDEKADRTMQAMLGMIKLDIAALQRAHDGA